MSEDVFQNDEEVLKGDMVGVQLPAKLRTTIDNLNNREQLINYESLNNFDLKIVNDYDF